MSELTISRALDPNLKLVHASEAMLVPHQCAACTSPLALRDDPGQERTFAHPPLSKGSPDCVRVTASMFLHKRIVRWCNSVGPMPTLQLLCVQCKGPCAPIPMYTRRDDGSNLDVECSVQSEEISWGKLAIHFGSLTPEIIELHENEKRHWIELDSVTVLGDPSKCVAIRASFGRYATCPSCYRGIMATQASEVREALALRANVEKMRLEKAELEEIVRELPEMKARALDLRAWLDSDEAKMALLKSMELDAKKQELAVYRDAVERARNVKADLEKELVKYQQMIAVRDALRNGSNA